MAALQVFCLENHGHRGLEGYSPQVHKRDDSVTNNYQNKDATAFLNFYFPTKSGLQL